MASSQHLVWVDLETTGLDVNKCFILEMACIITDKDLNIVAESPDMCVNYSEEILSSMERWPTEQHGKSGLTDSCRHSSYSLQDVEREMLKFVQNHVPKGVCPLAGNSVHFDKRFLLQYMPEFMSHLHYRIVDVSTVYELCRRWYGREIFDSFPKKSESHRALQDIRESIEELKYYRTRVFINNA